MKLFDMGASVIITIGVINLGVMLFDLVKPAQAPQCMASMKQGENTVQRWRDCRPEEIEAMR